jgi:hypothetical protein
MKAAYRLGLFGGAALAVTTLACSSSNASGASSDTQAGGQCHWPDSLNDGGPGACAVGLAYLKCTYESGIAGDDMSGSGPLFVGCLSNDVTGCPGGGPPGGTCTDMCGSNRYAVACGGQPGVTTPGGTPITYQEPPAGCTSLGPTTLSSLFCCPCE